MDPVSRNDVSGERTLCERIDREQAAAREVANAFEFGGNVADARDAFPHAPALVIGEQERPVPDEWASQGAAELVALVLRTLLGGRGEEVSRVERAVAEKLVSRAVKLVGAALQHDVHLPPGI